MPDNIWAELTYTGKKADPGQQNMKLAVSQGIEKLFMQVLPRKTAQELHRRINRMPEMEFLSREQHTCGVCWATAENAYPGLRKDEEGVFICINRTECIQRARTGYVQHDGWGHNGGYSINCTACRNGETIVPVTSGPDVVQVVMTPSMYRVFSRWLDDRGLFMFGIPVSGDDLPAYGVGTKDGF